jgi:hypothetical protein
MVQKKFGPVRTAEDRLAAFFADTGQSSKPRQQSPLTDYRTSTTRIFSMSLD